MTKQPLTKLIQTEHNIANSSKFKILSIDGGGIRGLYAAKLLAQIERKTGKPIGNYFDMLCGTSTGGLLALAITNGIPCSQVAEFYIRHGPQIFPYGNAFSRARSWLRQVVYSTKYSNNALIRALKEILGEDKTMEDAQHFLCIPSFNLTKGRPTVFKKPFGAYHRDGRFKMYQVALATSAAPTYLPSVTIENDQYVDGGIFANNPSLIGYTEAIDHFVGKSFLLGGKLIEYDGVSILSIGLPSDDVGELPNLSRRRSFLQWKSKLILSAMTGTAYIADYQSKRLAGSSYYRLEAPRLSSKQKKAIGMDNSSKNSIKTLSTFGQDVGDDYTSTKWQNLEPFFRTLKTYKFQEDGKL